MRPSFWPGPGRSTAAALRLCDPRGPARRGCGHSLNLAEPLGSWNSSASIVALSGTHRPLNVALPHSCNCSLVFPLPSPFLKDLPTRLLLLRISGAGPHALGETTDPTSFPTPRSWDNQITEMGTVAPLM